MLLKNDSKTEGWEPDNLAVRRKDPIVLVPSLPQGGLSEATEEP